MNRQYNMAMSLEIQYDGLIARAIHEGHLDIEKARCLCAVPFNVFLGVTMLDEQEDLEPLVIGGEYAERAVHMLKNICGLDIMEHDELQGLWRMK